MAVLLAACTDDVSDAPTDASSGAQSEGTIATDGSSTSSGLPLPDEPSSSSEPEPETSGTTTSGPAAESSGAYGSSSGDGSQDSTGGDLDPCAPVEGEDLPMTTPCDPLAQSCAAGLGCYFQVEGCPFQCIPTWGAGMGLGEECLYLNDCEPGLVCIDAVSFSSCDGAYCCTTYCDLDAPSCPGTGACEPYYAPGTEPAGFEGVGLCAGI